MSHQSPSHSTDPICFIRPSHGRAFTPIFSGRVRLNGREIAFWVTGSTLTDSSSPPSEIGSSSFPSTLIEVRSLRKRKNSRVKFQLSICYPTDLPTHCRRYIILRRLERKV